MIGAPAARFRGVPGRLGRLNAMRNPRRTASTAAALMIGLGLVSFVTILAASLKTSFAATLDRSMQADYIIEGPMGGQQKFSREVALRMAKEQELAVVSPMRFSGEFKLDGETKHNDAVDPYTFGDVMDIDIRKGQLVDFLPGTMLDLRQGGRRQGVAGRPAHRDGLPPHRRAADGDRRASTTTTPCSPTATSSPWTTSARTPATTSTAWCWPSGPRA